MQLRCSKNLKPQRIIKIQHLTKVFMQARLDTGRTHTNRQYFHAYCRWADAFITTRLLDFMFWVNRTFCLSENNDSHFKVCY